MKRALLLVALLALVAGIAAAQDLLTDNPTYRQARQLENQARQAFAGGDYERSTQLARQAEELGRQAVREAEERRLAFMAHNLRNLAEERIRFADSVKAMERYPDIYVRAKASHEGAIAAFNSRAWQASIDGSRRTIELLRDITPLPRVGMRAPGDRPAKPAFYVVRLIPERRDCLWRIAEYDFIYGDPSKWPLIYEANRDKLPDPANPDLILPEMTLVIPALPGETREGTWRD